MMPGPMRPPMPMPPPGAQRSPAPMDAMGMGDLGPAPMMDTPEGVALWGNPVLDAPTLPVEELFPIETAPTQPLDQGLGMPPEAIMPMTPEDARESAMAALAQ